ncbi:hypothetical protein Wxf_02406 [Wolbachia endosymbiont of Armadillidium vulgare]|nr:hypothetical protein Wxf_00909 [Wolbachia endosymbiont of Armadillidium vulgare]OJH32260.1 hypothetical protein Wxf_01688 [Wolbachia endosymbiont of Armadillidium vulgare]OJH32943.1 hypothetical protein Wxf_02406 [Wolbachia endosymbiont of Armadillidium vulgare]
MTSKDQNKKTNVNHKKIFGALESVDIEQSKFVSKINNQKEINRETSLAETFAKTKSTTGKDLTTYMAQNL